MNYKDEKEETACFMSRLYTRKLTTCSGGNISVRVSDTEILITPSALDKGNLKGENIALVTLDGKNQSINLKLSIETEMHLAIYRARPDINGIVHAHPLYGSLFSAAHKAIGTDILAESRFLLGEPKFAPYALMGTKDLAKIVGETFSAQDTRVVLMENHGVITVGKSLFQAYDRMEVLEAAAQMTYLSETMGGVQRLTSDRLKEIDKMAGCSG